MLAAGLLPADFAEAVEVWPENQAAYFLFCDMQTQWYVGAAGATGLNYLVLLALMDRMKLSTDDHDDLFEDVQTLERAALTAMNAKD
jgi:hypothetical protein